MVGNSGSLLFREAGARIDAADAVFRFNQAPTAGYGSYVGSRTNIESLNAAWVKALLDSDEDGEDSWLWRTAATNFMLFELVDPIGLNHRTSYAINIHRSRLLVRAPQIHAPIHAAVVWCDEFPAP